MLAGIDASDGIFDGVTLLRVVMDSLQIIRTDDVALQAQRFSRKITQAIFVMMPGGMQEYLGIVDQHRLALVNIKRPLSDAEILGRVKTTLQTKHEAIDAVFREMRIEERKFKVETTFKVAKARLSDAYRYDVPDSAKTEKPPTAILANFTPAGAVPPGRNNNQSRWKRKREEGPPPRRKRRSFPAGSCKNCPDSTSHTIDYCYKVKRKEKRLPVAEQWCTSHTESAHWDSECRRHPHNRKNRKQYARASLLEAEVTKQITAMVANTNAPRVSVTRDSPPSDGPPVFVEPGAKRAASRLARKDIVLQRDADKHSRESLRPHVQIRQRWQDQAPRFATELRALDASELAPFEDADCSSLWDECCPVTRPYKVRRKGTTSQTKSTTFNMR